MTVRISIGLDAYIGHKRRPGHTRRLSKRHSDTMHQIILTLMRPSTAYRCNFTLPPVFAFYSEVATHSIDTFGRDFRVRARLTRSRHRALSRSRPDSNSRLSDRLPHATSPHSTYVIDRLDMSLQHVRDLIAHEARERTRKTIGLATRHRDWTRVWRTTFRRPRHRHSTTFLTRVYLAHHVVPDYRDIDRRHPTSVGASASIPPSALVLVPHATQYSRRLLFPLHFSLHFSTLLPYSCLHAFVLLVFSVLRFNNNKGHEFGPCL